MTKSTNVRLKEGAIYERSNIYSREFKPIERVVLKYRYVWERKGPFWEYTKYNRQLYRRTLEGKILKDMYIDLYEP